MKATLCFCISRPSSWPICMELFISIETARLLVSVLMTLLLVLSCDLHHAHTLLATRTHVLQSTWLQAHERNPCPYLGVSFPTNTVYCLLILHILYSFLSLLGPRIVAFPRFTNLSCHTILWCEQTRSPLNCVVCLFIAAAPVGWAVCLFVSVLMRLIFVLSCGLHHAYMLMATRTHVPQSLGL